MVISAYMIAKIIANIVNNLLGRGLAFLTEYFKKRKVEKLEKQVSSLKDKVLILEREKSFSLCSFGSLTSLVYK